MDLKTIAAKELSGQNVDSDISTLDDAQQKEYVKTYLSLAKEEKAKELEALKGLRSATAAVGAGKQQDEEARKKAESDYQTRQRSEQLQKAKARLISEFKLSDEQLKKVEEGFKTEDSGAVDADFIFSDLKKAYVKTDADSLLEARKKNAEFEKNAADLVASAAGASGSGAGGDNGKQLNPEVLKVVRAAKAQGVPMTYDEAERGLKRGKTWKVR